MRGFLVHCLIGCVAVTTPKMASAQQRTDVHFMAVLRSWEKHNDSAVFSINATDTAASSGTLNGHCTAKGKCRIDLPLDHVYRLELSATGHVPKHVVLDLTGPSAKQRKWGYRMRIAVVLMPRIEHVDYTICERPLGLAFFDPKENQFTWNEDYSIGLTPYYETMQNQYEEVKGKHGVQP